MTDINDGGPAFPLAIAVSVAGDLYDSSQAGAGQSLRDCIAIQAMVGLMASGTVVGLRELDIALSAYSQADAMLKARAKDPTP